MYNVKHTRWNLRLFELDQRTDSLCNYCVLSVVLLFVCAIEVRSTLVKITDFRFPLLRLTFDFQRGRSVTMYSPLGCRFLYTFTNITEKRKFPLSDKSYIMYSKCFSHLRNSYSTKFNSNDSTSTLTRNNNQSRDKSREHTPNQKNFSSRPTNTFERSKRKIEVNKSGSRKRVLSYGPERPENGARRREATDRFLLVSVRLAPERAESKTVATK